MKSRKIVTFDKKANAPREANVFEEAGFAREGENIVKEFLFKVKRKGKTTETLAKSITGSETITFRAFVKKSEEQTEKLNAFEVLVVKESGNKLLGWRVYHRK